MLVVVSASTALAGIAPSDRSLFRIAATGSPGGTYYEYGQALEKLLSRILNLRVVTQATLGARKNIQLIEDGSAQLGFVPMGIALEAWNGSGDWAHGEEWLFSSCD
jgi:uncharacterized protein